jgi:hypothetical protein
MRELLPMVPGLRSCTKSLILDLILQVLSCCMMPSMVECLPVVWAENMEKVNAKWVGISMHLEYARPVLSAWTPMILKFSGFTILVCTAGHDTASI